MAANPDGSVSSMSSNGGQRRSRNINATSRYSPTMSFTSHTGGDERPRAAATHNTANPQLAANTATVRRQAIAAVEQQTHNPLISAQRQPSTDSTVLSLRDTPLVIHGLTEDYNNDTIVTYVLHILLEHEATRNLVAVLNNVAGRTSNDNRPLPEHAVRMAAERLVQELRAANLYDGLLAQRNAGYGPEALSAVYAACDRAIRRLRDRSAIDAHARELLAALERTYPPAALDATSNVVPISRTVSTQLVISTLQTVRRASANSIPRSSRQTPAGSTGADIEPANARPVLGSAASGGQSGTVSTAAPGRPRASSVLRQSANPVTPVPPPAHLTASRQPPRSQTDPMQSNAQTRGAAHRNSRRSTVDQGSTSFRQATTTASALGQTAASVREQAYVPPVNASEEISTRRSTNRLPYAIHPLTGVSYELDLITTYALHITLIPDRIRDLDAVLHAAFNATLGGQGATMPLRDDVRAAAGVFMQELRNLNLLNRLEEQYRVLWGHNTLTTSVEDSVAFYTNARRQFYAVSERAINQLQDRSTLAASAVALLNILRQNSTATPANANTAPIARIQSESTQSTMHTQRTNINVRGAPTRGDTVRVARNPQTTVASEIRTTTLPATTRRTSTNLVDAGGQAAAGQAGTASQPAQLLRTADINRPQRPPITATPLPPPARNSVSIQPSTLQTGVARRRVQTRNVVSQSRETLTVNPNADVSQRTQTTAVTQARPTAMNREQVSRDVSPSQYTSLHRDDTQHQAGLLQTPYHDNSRFSIGSRTAPESPRWMRLRNWFRRLIRVSATPPSTERRTSLATSESTSTHSRRGARRNSSTVTPYGPVARRTTGRWSVRRPLYAWLRRREERRRLERLASRSTIYSYTYPSDLSIQRTQTASPSQSASRRPSYTPDSGRPGLTRTIPNLGRARGAENYGLLGGTVTLDAPNTTWRPAIVNGRLRSRQVTQNDVTPRNARSISGPPGRSNAVYYSTDTNATQIRFLDEDEYPYAPGQRRETAAQVEPIRQRRTPSQQPRRGSAQYHQNHSRNRLSTRAAADEGYYPATMRSIGHSSANRNTHRRNG